MTNPTEDERLVDELRLGTLASDDKDGKEWRSTLLEREAADRIEVLAAENARLREWLRTIDKFTEERPTKDRVDAALAVPEGEG